MPTYSYPGVYVEEIPSGVRTITGVSTSNTAFVDFFARGPVGEARRITSFADFERTFGGLDTRSEASYAIQQYFLNGGSVAWVVRVVAGEARRASTMLEGGSPPQDTLLVEASSEGEWGNRLEVAVDRMTPAPDTLFNLVVRLVETVGGKETVIASETYRNLSMQQTSPQYAIDVVNKNSQLIRLTDEGLGELPTPPRPDADVINAPQPGDFIRLGLYGGTEGSDGDAPPRFDGDAEGANWQQTTGAAALIGSQSAGTGLYALEHIAPEIFNILCLPAAANLEEADMRAVYATAAAFCEDHRAFLIVDIPATVDAVGEVLPWKDANAPQTNYGAVYFPRLLIADPLNGFRDRNVAPSGTLAGVYARTDATRGVWKAPAGTEASLRGARLALTLTDLENGGLNPFGVNALRNFPIYGNVSWGARTLEGADQQASEWKYIPVRRTALFIEESLYQGLKWVVFEPNDEALWSAIRLNVGAFMNTLFRQGAFQGDTPAKAYFVRCDSTTTTQNDIDQGIVNIIVGFAPLKPAEFVVIKIQQMAGQVQV